MTAKLTGTKLNENCNAENHTENNEMNHSYNPPNKMNKPTIDNQKRPANIQKANIESNNTLEHNNLSEKLDEVKPFHVSDGWDDDFLLDDEFEIKEDKEPPITKDIDIDTFEKKNILPTSPQESWDFEFEEKCSSNKPINRIKPMANTNTRNETNQSSKPKKGPMKLGAQKLKKTLD